MAGLVPATHVFNLGLSKDVDARDKPGTTIGRSVS
jgi:hypothetical protein